MALQNNVPSVESDPCERCHAPVYGYVARYCCNGHECACMAMPIEPCWCDDCWKAYTEEAEGRAEFMAVNS